MSDFSKRFPVNVVRGIVPTQISWDGVTGFGFQAKTGGTVFTDLTTACNNATANDVPFFDAATIQLNDAFYFGDTNIQFNQIKINVGTAGVYAATLVWEYWNGSAWTTLTVTDATNFLTVSGLNYVTFTVPADQAKVTVNAQNAWWVRLRISAFTSVTTNPLGTQVFMGAAPTSLANATDGNITTSTGQASINKAGSGTFGFLIFDMGAAKTLMWNVVVGVWSSANSIQIFSYEGTDGSTFNTALSGGNNITTDSDTSEKRLVTSGFLSTQRYVRIGFAITGASATCNVKVYEAMAWELKV